MSSDGSFLTCKYPQSIQSFCFYSVYSRGSISVSSGFLVIGFPIGGSCPRSGLMRAKFILLSRSRSASVSPPLIRPCGATFSLRAKSRLRRLRSDTRLRAQPQGGRLLEDYTNTACTSTIYRAVPTAMLSSVFFFHRCSPTTAAPASSSGRPWVGPSRSTPRRQ